MPARDHCPIEEGCNLGGGYPNEQEAGALRRLMGGDWQQLREGADDGGRQQSGREGRQNIRRGDGGGSHWSSYSHELCGVRSHEVIKVTDLSCQKVNGHS